MFDASFAFWLPSTTTISCDRLQPYLFVFTITTLGKTNRLTYPQAKRYKSTILLSLFGKIISVPKYANILSSSQGKCRIYRGRSKPMPRRCELERPLSFWASFAKKYRVGERIAVRDEEPPNEWRTKKVVCASTSRNIRSLACCPLPSLLFSIFRFHHPSTTKSPRQIEHDTVS